MMIYSRASQKSIEAAVKKAMTVKPRVKVLGFGRFQVAGSKGDSYQVTFSKNEAGEFTIECGCQANSKKGSACYHSASAAGIYKLQVKERAAAAKAAVPVLGLFCGCGNIATSKEGRCTECQVIKDRLDLGL